MTPQQRRGLAATVAAASAVFVAVLVVLAVQMARGDDPALGAGKRVQKAHVVTTPAPAPVVPPAGNGYDDGSGYADGSTYDDGSAYGDQGYGTAVAPQQQPAAPLQSTTS